MIVSHPKGLIHPLIKILARHRLRTAFGALYAHDWHRLLGLPHGSSLLVFSNHGTWWDEMLLLEIFAQIMDFDGYWMTDENRLKHRPALGRLGAFSLCPHDPEDCRRSVQHVRDLLERPGRAVGVFASGKKTSRLEDAAATPAVGPCSPVSPDLLAELLGQNYDPHVWLLNLAIYCDFLAGKKPEWFLQVGQPVLMSDWKSAHPKNEQPAALLNELASLQRDLDQAITNDDLSAFSLLWKG